MLPKEIRKPEFITFTGADNVTNVQTMRLLSGTWPIEWGILFSPSRQGNDHRYPSNFAKFLGTDLKLSAHLCGKYSRAIVEKREFALPICLSHFGRAQINHRSPDQDIISDFQKAQDLGQCIGQWRSDTFPETSKIAWLYDISGGHGSLPSVWPKHPGYFVGYAGGINPENVVDIIQKIDANGPYWIDMESGVRTNNFLDLNLCERVCRAVYD